MKTYMFNKIALKGWFLGNFIPTVHECDKGEIAIKKYIKNHIETQYRHENARTVYSVLSGEIRFNGCLARAGSVVCFDKGEAVSFRALTDALVMLVVYGSPNFTRGKNPSLPDMRDIYDAHFRDVDLSAGKTIESKDVSVVVQGAIDAGITKCTLQSIREHYPESPIILSTWKGSDIDGLDFDECVSSDDPGGNTTILRYTKNKKYTNNTNRQLVSAKNGFEKVETEYALKLRSDMIVLNNNLLRTYSMFPEYNRRYRIFREKIAVSCLFTRREFEMEFGKSLLPMPFHVSDWFYFGLTEDVRTYVSETPLMSEEDMQYPSERLVNRKLERIYDKYSWSWRYAPEQYYTVKAAQRKFPEIVFRDWTDCNEENVAQSEDFILNNFIILDLAHSGITMPKHEPSVTANTGGNYMIPGLYRFDFYRRYYKDVILGGGESFDWDYVVGSAENPFAFV